MTTTATALRRPAADPAVLALVVVTVTWGSSFVVLKNVLAEVPVADFLAARFLLAAVVLWLAVPGAVRRLSPTQLRQGIALGAIYGTAQLLQGIGLEHTSVAVSGFLTSSYVVLTPVLGAVALKLAISRQAWLATWVAGLGLAVISLHGLSIGGGELITIASAVAFAAHILATGRWADGVDVIGLTIVQLFAVAVVCGLGAAPGGLELPVSTGGWLALVYMALVSGALALVVQTWAQARISPTRAAIVMSAEPLWAAALAVVFVGESLGPRVLVGAALILAATYLAEAAPRGHPGPVEPALSD